jgi:hypothetical protein
MRIIEVCGNAFVVSRQRQHNVVRAGRPNKIFFVCACLRVSAANTDLCVSV